MPTGIEEVGLVLAIWPIVMGALKFYAEERGVSQHLMFRNNMFVCVLLDGID
jgi:hypothetical protein